MSKLRSIEAAVKGEPYRRRFEGRNFDGTVPGDCLPTDVIAATMYLGEDAVEMIVPSVRWTSARSCRFLFRLSAEQTAGLKARRTYEVIVHAARGGTSYSLAAFRLPVKAAVKVGVSA